MLPPHESKSPGLPGKLGQWPNDDQMSSRLNVAMDGLPAYDQKSPMHNGILDGGNSPDGQQKLNGATGWFVDLIRPAIFTKGGPRKQLFPTAYLDGLRGFAAFVVYWHHHQLWPRTSIFADRVLENGFGFEDKYYFACIPGIRTFFSGGHFAVAIFFVISGYVLSAKPLRLIQAGEHEKLGDSLSSALFRRWLRLHIPVACTSFLFLTSFHAFNIWTVAPKHEDTYGKELWRWYVEFKNFSFVFRTGGDPWLTYNFHAWSIPVEFRGSIAVYTTLMAISRCTRNARLACEVGLMVYFMYIVDGWFAAMFIAGMFLCDLDTLARNNNLPRFLSSLEPYKNSICLGAFAIGMWLGGIPSHIGSYEGMRLSPGWYYLGYLKPQAVYDYKWFYLFWAAICIVASTSRLPWLKKFFEMPFNQYLGRISFSLYLVHGPILWTVADRLYSATGWYREENLVNTPQWIDVFPLSHKGPLGFEPSFLGPQLIILPLTLWSAEIVTKLFDEPSVRFSQWLYNKTLGGSPAQK